MHSREAQYQFIRDFAAARTTLDDILVRQVLTLDYYLRDYARKRPSFALEQDSYKEEIRAVCLKAFPESSYKDVIRDYHIEVFVPLLRDRVRISKHRSRPFPAGKSLQSPESYFTCSVPLWKSVQFHWPSLQCLEQGS